LRKREGGRGIDRGREREGERKKESEGGRESKRASEKERELIIKIMGNARLPIKYLKKKIIQNNQ
jgi:hypothetical protein